MERSLSRILIASAIIAALTTPAAAVEPGSSGPERERGCLAAAKARLFADKVDIDSDDRTDDYDVRHWKLDLTLEPATRSFSGEVTMHFAPLSLDLGLLVMDVDGLAIDEVIHGGGAAPFTVDGMSLEITLPLLKAGSQDSVTVRYRGIMGVERAGLAYHDWDEASEYEGLDGYVVASLSQPEAARSWWPTKDRPGDKATAEIVVTAPDDLVVVSNGRQGPVNDNGDGTATWWWSTEHAIATYLISVAASDYEEFGESCVTPDSGPIDLRNWVFPQDREDAETDFSPLCDMMRYMETVAGPYPFADEKYGHAMFMNTDGGAMEHQTVTSYGYSLVRGTNVKDWVVMHELAHQWYGDLVTPETWRDIWLNEGFATYFEALWKENLYGEDAYFMDIETMFWSDSVWEGQTPVYDPFPNVLDQVVYDKGAWILHMLRGRMRILTGSDDAFFALLREWTQHPDNHEHIATTDEFIAMAGEHTGQSVAAFMWPYLEQDRVPRLRLLFDPVDGPGGTDASVTVTLADASGVAFDNIYPLRIVTATGDELRTLRLVGSSTEATFDLASEVRDVVLDPDHWLAYKLDDSPRASFRIEGVSPTPSDGEVVVRFMLEEDTEISLEVFDVRGRRVLDRSVGVVSGSLVDERTLTWDGRDGDGRRVASGAYWLRLRGPGIEGIARAVLIN